MERSIVNPLSLLIFNHPIEGFEYRDKALQTLHRWLI